MAHTFDHNIYIRHVMQVPTRQSIILRYSCIMYIIIQLEKNSYTHRPPPFIFLYTRQTTTSVPTIPHALQLNKIIILRTIVYLLQQRVPLYGELYNITVLFFFPHGVDSIHKSYFGVNKLSYMQRALSYLHNTRAFGIVVLLRIIVNINNNIILQVYNIIIQLHFRFCSSQVPTYYAYPYILLLNYTSGRPNLL